MAPTRTIKNKHAANKSGIVNSKAAASKKPVGDGVIKSRNKDGKKKPIPGSNVKGRPSFTDLAKKKKKRVYTAKELGIPELNMITPVGVTKPKGKKKGKVFVDDRESMSTILAIVQAEKEGQIESKMIKARQMEEIREARKIEAEKKDQERQARLEETKDVLRKKRKRKSHDGKGQDEDDKIIKDAVATSSNATKVKGNKKGGKKRVSFAAED
ncbi:hypothetical protein QBC46DRAFT_370767 [Diplogelasinospora grovesii]|uniref:60S ribosomal subunit assembly/export protein LOC1 n=1 Tax=Diplogelasinospora grovesii TaxID=303347 RepID=A0AAN6NJ56_9PEZI|nr:hypothetical protein QBC46DRAFT_370767 [Diplogelasinospora grovesii]